MTAFTSLNQAALHSRELAANAVDIQRLEGLKARSDDEATVREVARQFESLFLHQMLKSMRQANAVFEEGNLLSNSETGMYRDMLDQQLSLSLSRSQSLGIAEAVVRQIRGNHSPRTTEPGKLELPETRISKPDMQQVHRPAASVQTESENRKQNPEVDSAVLPAPVSTDVVSRPLPETFASPEAFVEHLFPFAEQSARRLGINPETLLAQAALETGWGQHVIGVSDGKPSYNLFGIKADARWQGNKVAVSTTEYRDGKPVNERAFFRVYDSWQESFEDYADFVLTQQRYQAAVQAPNDAGYVKELHQAGYATDPHYAEKILAIARGHRLQNPEAGNPKPIAASKEARL